MRAVAPEAFQDWYGENHPILRPDDGGTEGPEWGAKRRWGWGLRRGAVAPPQYAGLGATPPENLTKNQCWNCTFSSIFASKNKMVSSSVLARHVRKFYLSI